MQRHPQTVTLRDGHTRGVVVVMVDFFLFFFFSCSHDKRNGQGPAELMKELTTITKILQFASISSKPLSFTNRGGDPACVARAGIVRGVGEA